MRFFVIVAGQAPGLSSASVEQLPLEATLPEIARRTMQEKAELSCI